jgi:hypothetical protein
MVMDGMAELNLLAGWLGCLAGVLSGIALGLFFHNPQWLGGYGSWQRRMVRLGHISFFGIGFLNLAFAFTIAALQGQYNHVAVPGYAFIAGLILMPAVCFASAWRTPFRQLFFLPVVSVLIGVLGTLWIIVSR